VGEVGHGLCERHKSKRLTSFLPTRGANRSQAVASMLAGFGDSHPAEPKQSHITFLAVNIHPRHQEAGAAEAHSCEGNSEKVTRGATTPGHPFGGVGGGACRGMR
jgi:hypothetical protein